MKRNNNLKNDNIGAIGIGAMIVFIALILVAAVASAVIIQTGEKLQQNAQQTGDDTQREISGKITINNAYIKSTEVMRVYFESAPGSGIIATEDVAWQVSCTNSATADPNSLTGPIAAGYQFTAGTFGDGDTNGDGLITANDIPSTYVNHGNPGAAVAGGDTYAMSDPDWTDDGNSDGNPEIGEADNTVDEILPGDAYIIDIDVDADGAAGGDDCTFDEVGINGEITFWIHVEGGGSTYETVLITDTTVGALLI